MAERQFLLQEILRIGAERDTALDALVAADEGYDCCKDWHCEYCDGPQARVSARSYAGRPAMSEHTKEPWRWAETPDQETTFITAKDVPWIADICGDWPEPARSNARRIVACVNACAGLSTEALESGALKIALKNIWSYLDYVDDENHLCSAGPAWNEALRAYLAKLEGK
jgi:hypothetical protein